MAKRSAASEPQEDTASPLHPKLTEHILGQGGAEKQLLAWIESGRFPHALLLTGPRGIGKATLAYRLARFLLAPKETGAGLFGEALPAESLHLPPTHPTFRRMAAGGHPDLLVLESDDIKIDEARRVGEFLSLTPAESAWRVVIIDSADAMNRNAANALLKILEEPPSQAALILVSHNPGMLLPTIRSRCRSLRIPPIGSGDFARILMHIAPDIATEEYSLWELLSAGSPGLALELSSSGADTLYREWLERLEAPDTLKLHSFAERFARKDAEREWQVLSRLILWGLARIAGYTDAASMEAFPGEREKLAGLRASKSLAEWTDLWERAGKLLSDTDRLYLDRKQTLITLMRGLRE